MRRRLSTTVQGWLDGSDKSAAGAIFRTLGNVVSLPYSGVVQIRNWAYDRQILKSTSMPVPVVSVGNLTMGGVGKTPVVAAIAEYFISMNKTPGLVSRGYGSQRCQTLFEASPTDKNSENRAASSDSDAEVFAQYRRVNDEARELELRLPNVPHFLGANRVETVDALLKYRSDVDVVVLDDAFQHRRIARNLDVVLLDALNPFGGGRVAPSGFLREPPAGLKRADVVLLNRADLLDERSRREIQRRALQLAPNALWGEIAQRPNAIFTYSYSEGRVQKLDYNNWRRQTAQSSALAFCGLGAPAGFRKTLEKETINVSSFLTFPDHHAYSQNDLTDLERIADQNAADFFITTMKDFVKIIALNSTNKPIYALGIGVEFISNRREFEEKLLSVFAS